MVVGPLLNALLEGKTSVLCDTEGCALITDLLGIETVIELKSTLHVPSNELR